LRGKVWAKAIGNHLQITPELFKLLERKKESSASLSSDNNPRAYLSRMIEIDIPRTWTGFEFFVKHCNGVQCQTKMNDNEGPFYDQLRTVLETYAEIRSDVGYVQGMTYIAGMLSLCMDTYDTFVCFSNLLNCHFFLALFKMDVQEILQHVTVFKYLFEQHMPDLYYHFFQENISPEHYLVSTIG